MRKALLAIAALLAALVLVFAAVVALQPADFTIERSAAMAAPPEEVFAQVNDFKNWKAWSPWAKRDPNQQETYGAATAGAGAAYAWSGNNDVGEGKMTITESLPAQRIAIRLEFIRPMEDASDVVFTFAPDGPGTRLTWTMTGTNGYLEKTFALLMDLDKMVGGDFEQGLAAIKTLVETGA